MRRWRATHIVGLATNVAFLRRVVATHGLRDRRPRHRADRARARRAVRARRRCRSSARRPASSRASWRTSARCRTPTRGSRRDGWRLHGGATRRFDLDVGGTRHAVTLHRAARRRADAVGGRAGAGRFARAALGDDRHDVTLGDRRWTLAVYAQGERVTVFAPEGTLSLQEVDPLAHAGEGAAPGGSADRADAGQGGRVPGAGRRGGQGRPAAGGDGGDEDGAHHRRAARRHGGRAAVRAWATRWPRAASCCACDAAVSASARAAEADRRAAPGRLASRGGAARRRGAGRATWRSRLRRDSASASRNCVPAAAGRCRASRRTPAACPAHSARRRTRAVACPAGMPRWRRSCRSMRPAMKVRGSMAAQCVAGAVGAAPSPGRRALPLALQSNAPSR